jgi:hypothetical protein
MRRHADLTRRNPKYKLIFVSNIRHKNAALRSLPGYLHPRDADHLLIGMRVAPATSSTHRG